MSTKVHPGHEVPDKDPKDVEQDARLVRWCHSLDRQHRHLA